MQQTKTNTSQGGHLAFPGHKYSLRCLPVLVLWLKHMPPHTQIHTRMQTRAQVQGYCLNADAAALKHASWPARIAHCCASWLTRQQNKLVAPGHQGVELDKAPTHKGNTGSNRRIKMSTEWMVIPQIRTSTLSQVPWAGAAQHVGRGGSPTQKNHINLPQPEQRAHHKAPRMTCL
jgi:hypothetical protein